MKFAEVIDSPVHQLRSYGANSSNLALGDKLQIIGKENNFTFPQASQQQTLNVNFQAVNLKY